MSSARRSRSRDGVPSARGSSSSGDGGVRSARSGGGGGRAGSTPPITSTTSSPVASIASNSSNSNNNKESGSTKETPSLRQLVKERLLNDVLESTSTKWKGWKIMVVDDDAMRVISSAVGMYDIMEKKVTLVESLHKQRAPFGDMAVIYIISATRSESVQLLLEDFSKKPFLYGSAVFIYFLGKAPPKVMETLKQCAPLVQRLQGIAELNIDFLVREDRVFTFDMRSAFPRLYLRNGPSPVELTIAEKLVTVCATLNEYPHIRFALNSAVCNSLSSIFHMKMDEYVASNPNWWYHGDSRHSQRERSQLLLLDRAHDALSPLIHEFTYQAMVNDLLKIEDGERISYQAETATSDSTEAKDVLLNEKDPLWVELRARHIAHVIDVLSSRIRDVVNSNTGTAALLKQNSGDEAKQMSLSQMASALKQLPEYREVLGKLSQHMHIAHSCMDVFQTKHLLELSEVEQTLATGKTEDGRSPKLADMVSQTEDLLRGMEDKTDKLRLILIFCISQGGLRSADQERLVRSAGLSNQDLTVLKNLELMGLSVHVGQEQKKLTAMFTGGQGLASKGDSDDESEYANSRFVPALKNILSDLVQHKLSTDNYPSVLPMPEMAPSSSAASSARRRGRSVEGSARKSGATSRWSRTSGTEGSGGGARSQGGPQVFSGGRSIVFMVGGMSYSEVRVARDVMAKEQREIVIGSTNIYTPKEFLEDIAKLKGGF